MKKLSLIFILTFLLYTCSTDGNIANDDTNKIETTIENNTTRAGGNCYLPPQHLSLELEYSPGVPLSQKNQIRNTYTNFVGLTCVIVSGPNEETWIVDASIYNSYCQECIDANKCCRSEVIEEEEEDIEKLEEVEIFIDPIKN